MKRLSTPCALSFCFLLPVGFVIQGCVPVATGVIAYDNAISFQEHAAYTDYLFAQQAKNKSLQQAGEPIQTIIPERIWRNDYKLRLQYAHYYTRQTATNGEPHSFEAWKEIDYPQQEENERLLSRAPNDRSNLK